MLLQRNTFGRRKRGQIILAQRQRQIATLGDRHAVRQSARQIGKTLRHFILRRKVLLRREAFRPPRIGKDVTLGDAHAGFVRAELGAGRKLHRMCRDDRQRALRGEPRGGSGQGIVVAAAGALHFEIEAIRKKPRPRVGRGARRNRIALRERMAHVAAGEPGQRDQAVGPLGEPGALHFRASAMLVGAIGAGQPIGKPEIARARLAKQEQSMRRVALAIVSHPNVAADDRLDALGARGLVELDHAEHVAEIGECQRGHAIGGRGGNRLVEAHHPVDDRILAVEAQMDEADVLKRAHDVQFYSL